MYSSNNAGVVRKRVVLGTLKSRKQNFSGPKWRLSLEMYAEIWYIKKSRRDTEMLALSRNVEY